MGLYDDLQKDIKEALNSDLKDAYKTFTATRVTSSTYDKATGAIVKTEESVDFKGVLLKDEIDNIISNKEELESFEVLVLDSDKPFSFESDQKITYLGREQRITSIKTDPVNAKYNIGCIAWG